MMTEPIEKDEIERRFLVEIPLKWYGKFKVLTAERTKIYQTYLKEPLIDCSSSRVRTKCTGRGIEHTYTIKKQIQPGINREIESVIDQNEYRKKLESKDYTRKVITKTRYILRFRNQLFEFDVFEDVLLGLAILEIELKSLNDHIVLPPYLKIVREITNDNRYSNYNLASIGYIIDTERLIKNTE